MTTRATRMNRDSQSHSSLRLDSAVPAFSGHLPPGLVQAVHQLQVALEVELGELELQPHFAIAHPHAQRQLHAQLCATAVVAPNERVRAGREASDAHIGGLAVPPVTHS